MVSKETKQSWILMRVEDDDIYHWDGGGEWFTPDRWEYIGEDMICAIEEDPRLVEFMKTGPDVWMVLFVDVSWVNDSGYWDINYGWCAPGHHVEAGDCVIVEHDFDPEVHGLELGEWPEIGNLGVDKLGEMV